MKKGLKKFGELSKAAIVGTYKAGKAASVSYNVKRDQAREKAISDMDYKIKLAKKQKELAALQKRSEFQHPKSAPKGKALWQEFA